MQNVGGLDTKRLAGEKDSALIPGTDRPECTASTWRRSIAAKNSSVSSYPTANARKSGCARATSSHDCQSIQENREPEDSHIAW